MKTVLVLGAGQIGVPVAKLLLGAGYTVHHADLGDIEKLGTDHFVYPKIDLSNEVVLHEILKDSGIEAVLSCLPFALNKTVADVALAANIHYFDLTEDVDTTEYVKGISANSNKAFIPQCGLAPGYVSLVAQHLMDKFDKVDTVNMRVGALPQNPNNDLKYNLTWSTNGLINECGNPCKAIENGELTMLQPLEGLEHIVLDGVEYEAFNTSGGCGSLVDKHVGKVNTMNYRTMRYPGHRDLFKFLMFDLGLNEKRDIFTEILESAIPTTDKDIVIVYVTVKGYINGKYCERNLTTHNYGHDLPSGEHLTAIAATTAAGICAVVDMVLNSPDNYKGFCEVESISLDAFLTNQFGSIYEVE